MSVCFKRPSDSDFEASFILITAESLPKKISSERFISAFRKAPINNPKLSWFHMRSAPSVCTSLLTSLMFTSFSTVIINSTNTHLCRRRQINLWPDRIWLVCAYIFYLLYDTCMIRKMVILSPDITHVGAASTESVLLYIIASISKGLYLSI